MQCSETEKRWHLAAAFYKHGVNIEELMKELPNFKQIEIEKAICRYRLNAKKIFQNSAESSEKEQSIDSWYAFLTNCERIEGTSNIIPNSLYLKRRRRIAKSVIANKYTHLLGKNFMYAAYFEDHYRGKSEDDPDYSEIYRYLGQLLNGEEPTQVKPGSATKILEMLSYMKEVLRDPKSSRICKQQISKISPSYLNLDKPLTQTAIEKQMANAVLKPEGNCQLYKMDDNQECLSDIDDDDLSQDIFHSLKKISDKQTENGSYLLNVPGFNPLEMGLDCLSKPAVAMLLAQEGFKKS